MKHLLTLALVLCLGTFASAQIPSYVPTNGLVGWWPFNGNANDESGNGNHGFNNTAQLTADRFSNNNKAYQLGSGIIKLPTTVFRFNRTDSFTISIWFTHQANGNDRLLSTENAEGNFRIANWGPVPGRFATQFGDYLIDTLQFPNQWNHLVYTYQNRNEKTYINGQLKNVNYDIVTEGLNYGIPMCIGAKASSTNVDMWDGKVDDLAIYNRALTAAEVQQLYTGQSACNLTVNLAPSDTLAACGNSVNLNAGNPGANYLWNTGDSTQSISATQSGWYSATVTQNNCSATDSVYVNLLQVDLGNDTTVCRGNSLNIQPKGSISKILSNPTFSEVLKYQGKSYLVYNQMMTWEDAKKLGDSLGLQMYVINDQAEENAVYTALPEKGNDGVQYWLGLYQEINGPFYSEPAGGWRWVDGRYLHQGYSNWYAPDQPDNSNSEKYAQLEWAFYGPKWNDGGANGNCPCNFSKPIYETNNLFSSTLWSTGDTTPTINVTPTQTTTYYCTVSDGISTCTDSVTVFVTQPPVITLPDTLRSATRPVVLAPGNATSYLWSTGDTTANLSVNTAGTYSVTASNAAGCSSADSVLVLFSNPAPALPAASAGMFNYQASVVSGGKPLANRSLSVRFTVADSSATNYSEIQQITTDARGHFATQVGAGSPISGSLSDVSWWDGIPRTLKTEVDTNGSGNWVVLGSSSLVAVPVSMYALRSGDGSRSIYGSFDSNGNVVSGRGFSVTPLGNGKFELVFQQPFTELPNVIVKLVGSGTYNDKIINRNTQKTTIEITGNPDQIQFEAKGK